MASTFSSIQTSCDDQDVTTYNQIPKPTSYNNQQIR